MALLFLSYCHADRAKALRLAKALRAAGHEVWRDEEGIPYGASFPSEVNLALQHCEYLVVVVTENAIASDWVQDEVHTWLHLKDRKNILTACFGGASPESLSVFLSHRRHVDFSRSFKEGLAALLSALPKRGGRLGAKTEDFERLSLAIDLALRAGTVVMRYFNSSLAPSRALDERKNPSTEADKAAQIEIQRTMQHHERFALERVVSEEGAQAARDLEDDPYAWVVDPLDGTANFHAGLPFFCSAVGVLRHGKPYIGAIYEPVTGDLYFAAAGGAAGIWRVPTGDVRQLGPNPAPEMPGEAVLATHISSRAAIARRLVESGRLLTAALSARSVRAIGSGQLALAYVAAGRFHVFFQHGSYLWDQVAGVVLVERAGGKVMDLEAKHWSLKTESILAACNVPLARRFYRLLQHPKRS
jgi:myo-inositol-1(or 4)-monophosphatase